MRNFLFSKHNPYNYGGLKDFSKLIEMTIEDYCNQKNFTLININFSNHFFCFQYKGKYKAINYLDNRDIYITMLNLIEIYS